MNDEPSPLSEFNTSTEVTICSVVGPSAPRLRAHGFAEDADVFIVSHNNTNAVYKCNSTNTAMSDSLSKDILAVEKKKTGCDNGCDNCPCNRGLEE